jgi:hypothetical protein
MAGRRSPSPEIAQCLNGGYGYEICAFECPQCKAISKLVVRGNLGPLPKARQLNGSSRLS